MMLPHATAFLSPPHLLLRCIPTPAPSPGRWSICNCKATKQVPGYNSTTCKGPLCSLFKRPDLPSLNFGHINFTMPNIGPLIDIESFDFSKLHELTKGKSMPRVRWGAAARQRGGTGRVGAAARQACRAGAPAASHACLCSACAELLVGLAARGLQHALAPSCYRDPPLQVKITIPDVRKHIKDIAKELNTTVDQLQPIISALFTTQPGEGGGASRNCVQPPAPGGVCTPPRVALWQRAARVRLCCACGGRP